MVEPLDRIPILRTHLEQIFDALDWSLSYHKAEALRDAAKECKDVDRDTRLVVNLERALNHLVGYMVEENVNVPE
jgi:hypothetical protein